MISGKGHDMTHTAHAASNHCHKTTTNTCTNNMAQSNRLCVDHIIEATLRRNGLGAHGDIYQHVNAEIDDNVDSQGDMRGGEQHSTQTNEVGGVPQVPMDRPARVSIDGNGVELLRAYKRIKDLQAAAIGGRAVSKNKTRRCLRNLPATDCLNINVVYNFIDDKLWSLHHIRKLKWPRYSTNKKTMCQRILGCGVNIPPGSTEEEYWDSILVMSVNNKYTFAKSNVFEKLKAQHKGNVWAYSVSYILLMQYNSEADIHVCYTS